MNPILTAIASIAIFLGVLVDPLLTTPSITILHAIKSIINPVPVGPLYIIEYDAKDARSLNSFSPTINFFNEFKKNTLLFSALDWRGLENDSNTQKPLPIIGSTTADRGAKESPFFPELTAENLYSYKLPRYQHIAPMPKMISIGIIPSPSAIQNNRNFFPLLYYNAQRNKFAFSSPFLAASHLFRDNPKQVKISPSGLHQSATGSNIQLNKHGEFRLNSRWGLSKKIGRESLESFQNFIASNPSPKAINERIIDKITLLLPKGEKHEYLLQAFNTLATQEFIAEFHWLGWFIFAIPILILVFFASPLKGLGITTAAYAICSIALFSFGNIVTPFLSAGFSAGLIMSLIFIFSGRKPKKGKTLPTPDLFKETKWGRFQVISTIKKSSSAVLYRVVDKTSRKPALLKVFLESAGFILQAKKQLKRKAYSKIKSPFLVDVYEVRKNGEYLYMLMGDTGGIPLPELQLEGPIGVEKTVKFAEQLLKGLEVCHKNKLFHNNLKPGNILIERNGSLKLSDFGWTLLNNNPSIQNVESLYYKAPELLTGKKAPDQKTDLYSVGAIIFEMLTGVPPFRAKTIEELIKEKEKLPTGKIKEQLFEVPKWLDNFTLKLMSIKQADRPQSATEALELLHIGYGK